MTTIELLQNELSKIPGQLATLNTQLAQLKKFKEKQVIRKQINELEDRSKEIGKLLKKLEKNENKTEANMVAYANGISPTADTLAGVAGVINAGGSALTNTILGVGQTGSKLINAKGDAAVNMVNAQGLAEQGNSEASQGKGLLFGIIAILVLLFLFKR